MWEHRTNPGNPLSPAAWNGSSRRQRTSSGFPSPIPLECENLPFVSQDTEGLNKQNKSGGHLVRTTATLFFSAANFRLPFVLFLLHAAGRHPKLQLLKRLLTSHSFDVFFLRSVCVAAHSAPIETSHSKGATPDHHHKTQVSDKSTRNPGLCNPRPYRSFIPGQIVVTLNRDPQLPIIDDCYALFGGVETTQPTVHLRQSSLNSNTSLLKGKRVYDSEASLSPARTFVVGRTD